MTTMASPCKGVASPVVDWVTNRMAPRSVVPTFLPLHAFLGGPPATLPSHNPPWDPVPGPPLTAKLRTKPQGNVALGKWIEFKQSF